MAVKHSTRSHAKLSASSSARWMACPPSATLKDTEIEAILEKADALAAWASDVKEYALSQALVGKQWTGYKVVEGRSTPKYTDEADEVLDGLTYTSRRTNRHWFLLPISEKHGILHKKILKSKGVFYYGKIRKSHKGYHRSRHRGC